MYGDYEDIFHWVAEKREEPEERSKLAYKIQEYLHKRGYIKRKPFAFHPTKKGLRTKIVMRMSYGGYTVRKDFMEKIINRKEPLFYGEER